MSDEHTTSRWNVSHLARTPARSYAGLSHGDDGGWDDPGEATRRLHSMDFASMNDPARPLEMDWDDDELTTHMWNQLHMPAPSQRASLAATSRRALIAQQARDAAAGRNTLAKTRGNARKDSTVQLRAQNRQPTAVAAHNFPVQEASPEWAQDLHAYDPPVASVPPPPPPAPRAHARTKTQPFHPANVQQPPRNAGRYNQPALHQPATHRRTAPQHFADMRAMPAAQSATLRQPQLRLLPDRAVAMRSALYDAELEPQRTRSLWVRSLGPGLALFAAVFVARVLMFEGGAPAVPAASSAVQSAPPESVTPERAATSAVPAAQAAAPEAPATLAQPPVVPTRSSSARRSQLTAASDADDSESSRTPRRSREPRGSAQRAGAEGTTRERVTREERTRPRAEAEPTEAASAAPARASGRAVAAPAAATSGMLRINSRPWSKVFVDGKLVGTTPQMALTLSPGQHTIELVNSELEMSKTILVDIEPDQILTKVVNLIE